MAAVNGHNDTFVINDITLKVAPTDIHISKDSHNIEYQTLRTRSSQKIKTGYASISIDFNCTFVGIEEINKLRVLIAELRYFPFVYVENQFIRENIYPTGPTEIGSGPIILAFTGANIQVQAGTPETVRVSFGFVFFNYLPYTSFWQYKVSLTDKNPKPVHYPAGSQAWKDFVDPAISHTNPIKQIDGKTRVEFFELRTLPKSNIQQLEDSRTLIKKIANDQVFFDKVRDKIKTTNLETAINSTIAEQYPGSLAILNDVTRKAIMTAAPRSSKNSKSYRDSGKYLDEQEVNSAVENLTQQINKVVSAGDTTGFTAINELSTVKDNRGDGYTIYKRPQLISFSEDNCVVVGMTISIRNLLAQIPIAGHRYSTYQHIGSVDAAVTFDIRVTSDNKLQNINWFYDVLNENVIHNRHVPQPLNNLRVENDILNMLGMQEFIARELCAETISGQPGTYAVRLTLQESGVTAHDHIREQLKQEFVASDIDITKQITHILEKYINVKPIGFIPTQLKATDAQFNNVLTRFIGSDATISIKTPGIGASMYETTRVTIDKSASGLVGVSNELWNSVAGNKEQILALMSLTEEDCPGITLVQEYVYHKQMEADQTHGDKLINSTLNDLRTLANKTITRDSTKVIQDVENYKKLNFEDWEDIGWQETTDNPNIIANNMGVIQMPMGPTKPSRSEEHYQQIAAFKEKLRLSTQLITESNSFKKFGTFIRQFADSIIHTRDINLPQFAEVKKLLQTSSTAGVMHGLPAYQDFDLASVAAKIGKDQLEVDPDCFMFMQPEVMDNIIDPTLVLSAKRIAQESYESGITNMKQFFQERYLGMWVNTGVQEKIESNIRAATQNVNGTSTNTDQGIDKFYSGKTVSGVFTNATGSTGMTVPLPSYSNSKQINNACIDYFNNVVVNKDSNGKVEDVNATVRAQNALQMSLDPKHFLTAPISTEPVKQPVLFSEGESPKTNDGRTWGTSVPNGTLPSGAQLWQPIQGTMRISTPGGHWGGIRTASNKRKMKPGETRPHKGVDFAGEVNQNVFAIADGVIIRSCWDNKSKDRDRYSTGYSVWIRHSDGIVSCYEHLQDPLGRDNSSNSIVGHETIPIININGKPLSVGSAVAGGEPIGTIGRTGVYESPTHLHFQMNPPGWTNKLTENDTLDPNDYFAIQPYGSNVPVATPVKNYGSKQGPRPDGLAAGMSAADLCIDQFKESIRNGQAMRLVRAFPAFKLYFIQDDSGNRVRYGADDFFNYNSIADITCIRSRKIPVDLCEITLTNISGSLSNRKFIGKQDPRPGEDNNVLNMGPKDANGNPVEQTDDPRTVDTKLENPIASMLLQQGMGVELRLGYANDPDKLTTVFEGKIMEIEFSDSDDLIHIVCQSHAVELVQDIKGLEKPIKKSGWFVNDAYTDRLLESLLCEPEVVHFGRFIRSRQLDGNTNKNRFILSNKFTLAPTPQDDNIFVPPQEVIGKLDDGWFFKNMKYSMYHTTIWDVFQEMTLRHPGWIASAVPYKDKYGPRMTMFFGLPYQLYFASDPTNTERQEVADITAPDQDQKDLDYVTKREEIARRYGSIKPFRNYHLVTSRQHIISNNIRTTAKGTYNTVSVQYGDSSFDDNTQQLVQSGSDVLTMSVDAGLPDEDIVEYFAAYPNCQNEDMAKKYALSLLIKNLKDAYRGELTVIGNPEIKPYDIVYIFDDYNDIMGPVEVEQVIHRFSQETGFITEVTPDLYVTANEWVNMTASDLMSVIVSGTCTQLAGGTPTGTEALINRTQGGALRAGVAGLAGAALLMNPIGALVVGGLAIGGYFLAKKMVDFTSHGSPVVIHPLIHEGRPFIAGVPLYKVQSLWDVNKGQWIKEGTKGISMASVDFKDKLTFAESQGDIMNLFKGSTILPKW